MEALASKMDMPERFVGLIDAETYRRFMIGRENSIRIGQCNVWHVARLSPSPPIQVCMSSNSVRCYSIYAKTNYRDFQHSLLEYILHAPSLLFGHGPCVMIRNRAAELS